MLVCDDVYVHVGAVVSFITKNESAVPFNPELSTGQTSTLMIPSGSLDKSILNTMPPVVVPIMSVKLFPESREEESTSTPPETYEYEPDVVVVVAVVAKIDVTVYES